MKPNTIKNNRDYDAIAKRLEELVDAEPRTLGALELKEHIYAIIAYEQKQVKRGGTPKSRNTGL
ncbi:hypothetical protein AAE02nite_10630 [Adhaeribacter aerolatus]|uniref:Uncharacterized protein n=1 Tax=Adhaeribacter aerolatus TaxID=670289 RepID=A0A512AUK6_9BACT|nr:hypothetical protein [Adhaeribacter aerolatus]GEO03399.1 hypothetical protein AAE02nite_10630 [Adhaeribacter aerolatus]